MTSALLPSSIHCTKKHYPLFLSALLIIASISLPRATTRVFFAAAAAAFAPVPTRNTIIASQHYPCFFLWRKGQTNANSNSISSSSYSSYKPLRKITLASSKPNFDSMNILESPSAERNKVPIYKVLEETVLPSLIESIIVADDDDDDDDGRGKIRVLEVAAGCGVHTTHFASSLLSLSSSSSNNNKGLVGVEWHPSDPDAEARRSIDARVKQAELEDYITPANAWILGKTGGTACNDGDRDRGDAGLSQSGKDGDCTSSEYEKLGDFFDLTLCINMIHISPWEATVGLMECAGKVLRKGGMLVCYGPYKVDGKSVESNM